MADMVRASRFQGRRSAWSRELGLREVRHLLGTSAGRALVAVATAIALATVVGLVLLWPHPSSLRAKESVSRLIPAQVERVIDRRCADGLPQICRSLVVAVEGRTETIGLGMVGQTPAVAVGDAIRVTRPGQPDVRPAEGQKVHYDFGGFDRRGSIAWLAVVVAVAAAALLRWRGVLAVVGVGVSLAILLGFLVPTILAGRPPLLCGLVGALAVMFVTLVLTNGVGAQTLAAAVGISVTLGLTCVVGLIALRFTNLDGSFEPTLLSVRSQSGTVPLLGITLSAMLVGALGVLADTGVTQASAVMALRRADPSMGAGRLYRSAFVIGRDHLSATVHTLVLAYAGTVLPLLLILASSNSTTITALNMPELAEPIVATLVGCLALITAVPLTTGLASVFVARLPPELLAHGRHHHHH